MREEVARLKRQGNVGRAVPAAPSEKLASVLNQLSTRIETVLGVLAQIECSHDAGSRDVVQLARARTLCKALGVELSRVETEIFEHPSSQVPVRMRGHKGEPRRGQRNPDDAALVALGSDAALQRSTGS